MTIRVSIEQYDNLEWAIEINGMLWASGDCKSIADGHAQANAELRAAGIEVQS